MTKKKVVRKKAVKKKKKLSSDSKTPRTYDSFKAKTPKERAWKKQVGEFLGSPPDKSKLHDYLKFLAATPKIKQLLHNVIDCMTSVSLRSDGFIACEFGDEDEERQWLIGPPQGRVSKKLPESLGHLLKHTFEMRYGNLQFHDGTYDGVLHALGDDIGFNKDIHGFVYSSKILAPVDLSYHAFLMYHPKTSMLCKWEHDGGLSFVNDQQWGLGGEFLRALSEELSVYLDDYYHDSEAFDTGEKKKPASTSKKKPGLVGLAENRKKKLKIASVYEDDDNHVFIIDQDHLLSCSIADNLKVKVHGKLKLPWAVRRKWHVRMQKTTGGLLVMTERGYILVDVADVSNMSIGKKFIKDWRRAATCFQGDRFFFNYNHHDDQYGFLTKKEVNLNIPLGDGYAMQTLGGKAADIQIFEECDKQFISDVAVLENKVVFVGGYDIVVLDTTNPDAPKIQGRTDIEKNEVRVLPVPDKQRVILFETYDTDEHAVSIFDLKNGKPSLISELYPMYRAVVWCHDNNSVWVVLSNEQEQYFITQITTSDKPKESKIIEIDPGLYQEYDDLIWLKKRENDFICASKKGNLLKFEI